MSYRPTPAGHEDAPLEQRTHSEHVPQIDALRKLLELRVHPTFKDMGMSDSEWQRCVDELVSRPGFWSYDAVRRAFLDERVRDSLEKIRTFGPGFPSWQYASLLSVTSARVLEFGGNYPNIRREYLSSLHQSVILLDASAGLENLPRASNQIPLSLLVVSETSSWVERAEKSPLFESAVVVDFSEVPNPWVCCNMYIVPRRKPHAVVDNKQPITLVMDEQHIHMKSGYVPFSPQLHTYLDDLVTRCRHDPHSLHEHYGPTPGPTILDTLRTHLANVGIRRYVR